MGTLIYDADASVQQLLDRGFQMPIHFAAVGTNGSLIAGTYRALSGGHGFDCLITVENYNPDGLTAPVNIMYVDREGEAALIVLRRLRDDPQ